jgi:hypothetical protein
LAVPSAPTTKRSAPYTKISKPPMKVRIINIREKTLKS